MHVSQLADRFVKAPSDVVKVGDRLKVRVLDVDLERKRIALSAKRGWIGNPSGFASGKSATGDSADGPTGARACQELDPALRDRSSKFRCAVAHGAFRALDGSDGALKLRGGFGTTRHEEALRLAGAESIAAATRYLGRQVERPLRLLGLA